MRLFLLTVPIVWGCGAAPELQPPIGDSKLIYDPATASPLDYLKLGDLPSISLESNPVVTEEETRRIQKLIDMLAEIEHPDFGLSPTTSGAAFLPIAGRRSVSTVLFSNHDLQSSDALVELIKLGPKALPYLLRELDNTTPTKLQVEGIGTKRFAKEMYCNPISHIDGHVMNTRSGADDFPAETVESYRVKVGDVCFVAIGQIVGRQYKAVRYQPSMIIIINSPTRQPELCKWAREIWASDDPHRKLFDSLILDYSTEGVFNGESLDGWSVASRLQTEAALRLLYYYPAESASLIAKRLDSLNVSKTSDMKNSMERELGNGVRTYEFIEAVAWSDDPAIRNAIARIIRRSDDPYIVDITQKTR